jgi:hypothetical protein
MLPPHLGLSHHLGDGHVNTHYLEDFIKEKWIRASDLDRDELVAAA